MERPQDFKRDVQQIISHLGDVNQNDASRRDAEVQIPKPPASVDQTQFKQRTVPNEISPLNATPVPNTQASISVQKSNDHINSFMKDKNTVNSQTSLTPGLLSTTNIFDNSVHDLILPDAIMDIHDTQSAAKQNLMPPDVPMTSAELWDIPATLPATDSNSSLSDLVFTHAEESTLYDSILNTLGAPDALHEQMQVQPLPHDLNNMFFPGNNTTMTTSSTLPVMATGHDQMIDVLHVPSFSDMEMAHSLDPPIDSVTFLLDLDAKDSSMFHSNNSSSFPNL